MNIYFDTEFTGLKKDTTLVSIGLISEDERTFYAELTDFNWDQVHKNKWILENVINNLAYRQNGEAKYICNYHVGRKDDIAISLKNWFKQFEEVQLVSDVCHYDMVLLIDIFGGAFDLPKNVSPSCHDINQDIAKRYGISVKDAFDKSREEIVKDAYVNVKGEKHNALYDAKVIKCIYEWIYQVGK